MNVSLNWLQQHLDLSKHRIQELDDLLTFAGVEVEGIVRKGVASESIVVAKIVEAVQHPNADRLKVTQVDCGEAELRQIVCGATNYQVGDKVPCALPGSELPGGFTIGETVMRKVASRGMLCAAAEIGLPAGEDGLLILAEDAVIGSRVMDLFESDVLFELEVTPNRPDLLNHQGMARELATLLRQPFTALEIPTLEVPLANDGWLKLEDFDGCPYYRAITIDGVTVKESPPWLKARLESIGLRPINHIVDVTNYVMHALGHPLHAFDAAKIEGGIVVRRAAEGEHFTALDGANHQLRDEDIVIADAAGSALALAGVTGGLASGVTSATTRIVLEAAWFSPQRVRRTSRRSGISTDSSYRFERGVDPATVADAAALAANLIIQHCGGSLKRLAVAGEPPVGGAPVALDLARLDQLTGAAIPHSEAAEILTRLGLTELPDGSWDVPSFRPDLQRHIDLVEEVVRVHGLASIPVRNRAEFAPASAADAAYDLDMALRHQLAALGFHECQSIKLISDSQLADALPLRPLQAGDVIRVATPLSEDHAVMRPSIAPGLVASAARNFRQQAESVRLFEIGRVFRHMGGGKARDQESETLAILLAGATAPESWASPKHTADLYDLKAVLANLLPHARIQLVPRERDTHVLVHDIKADSQNIGVFARVLPSREREIDATSPVYLAEIDLTKLRKLRGESRIVSPLPQFPGSTRDAAMEIPLALANSAIEDAIAAAKISLLTEVACFDHFSDPTGIKLPADRKSLAYRFTYRAADRTLKSHEVDEAHKALLAHLEKALPLHFR